MYVCMCGMCMREKKGFSVILLYLHMHIFYAQSDSLIHNVVQAHWYMLPNVGELIVRNYVAVSINN